jgi:uncharacterized membrane protein
VAENNDDELPGAIEPEVASDEAHSEESSGRTPAELTVSSFEFSGPLPPPQILQGYNNAFAGCAERVVAMAERQSAHRQALERLIIESNCKAQSRGQLFAFILALVVLGGGVYLLAKGKSIEGFSAIILALASLTGALIYGQSQQEKERKDKERNLPHAPPPSMSSNDSDDSDSN